MLQMKDDISEVQAHHYLEKWSTPGVIKPTEQGLDTYLRHSHGVNWVVAHSDPDEEGEDGSKEANECHNLQ
jgi:hypothetical protein